MVPLYQGLALLFIAAACQIASGQPAKPEGEAKPAPKPAALPLPSISPMAPYTTPGAMSDKLSPELQKQIATRKRNRDFGMTKNYGDISQIEFEPRASFKELNERFARARREQTKIHPCGYSDLHILYSKLKTGQFLEAVGEEKWEQWAKDFPDDPTPLVVLGNKAIRRAWDARGSGLGYTVTEKGAIEFRKQLEIAREYLERAQKIEKADPEIYANFINTALGLETDRKQLEEWVTAGSKAFPRYRYLYLSFGNYLLPKWHGEGDELARRAEEFLTTLEGDDGYEAFALMLSTAADFYPQMVYLSGLKPGDVLKGCKVLYERSPKDDTLYDFCGVVAMRNLDQEFCRQLLPHLLKLERDDTLRAKIWHNLELFDQFVNFCAAPPVVDLPDQWFYLNLNGTHSMALVEGRDGPRAITSSNRSPAVLSIYDFNDWSKPVGFWPLGSPTGLYVLDAHGPSRVLAAICQLPKNSHVILYDTTESRPPVVIKCANPPTETLFSKDGSRFAIVYEESAEIVDPTNGKVLQTFAPFKQYRYHASQNAFSDDGKRLGIMSTEGATLWDAETGKQLKHFDRHANQKPGGVSVVWPLGFDAENRLLAGCGNDIEDPRRAKAPLFNIMKLTGDDFKAEKLGDIAGFQRVIARLDNELIAAISTFPGTTPEKWVIEIHDLKTGKRLRTIDGHPNYLALTSFSRDGRWYITNDMMGVTRLWKVPER